MPALTMAESIQTLRAEEVEVELFEDTSPTRLWGFNGSTPGPVLRVAQGDSVRVRFVNGLDQPSAIHWHGLRIDNPMDGVPDLTQDAVMPGDSFDYEFIAPDAGTYWFHSHHRSWEQVARGLYGALIVDEGDPPEIDHDIVVYIDDWRLNRDGSQVEDFENLHDQAHAGRLGNVARVIFADAPGVLRRGERIRLRLINAATDRIFPLVINGVEGKTVALDGMPVDQPRPLGELTLAPAQREDVIADVKGDEVSLDFLSRNGPYRLGELKVAPGNGRAARKEMGALPPNPYRVPDLARAIPLTLRMEGGAMSPRLSNGAVWAFNGQSTLAEVPFHSFARGETGRINIENRTRFPHGIHLHGHHFEILDDGVPAERRDTVLVDALESREIACVFDNPGKWLLHCHMLGHQASGMKTWIQVG